MKGSIIRQKNRKTGKLAKTWTIIYTVDKKQVWRGGFPRRKAAEAELAARVAKIHTGTWHELKNITFKELTEKWLEDYARVTVKPSTLRSYNSMVRKRLLPYFGDQPVASIRPDQIQAFLAQAIEAKSARGRTLSPKSANHGLVLLKEILQQGKRWGYLRENPAAEIKRARVEHREMDFYEAKEVRLLLDEAKKEDGITHPLLMTAVLTGMRRNELLALRWGDMDWVAGQIRVRQQLFKLTRKEAGERDRWRFSDLKSRYSRRAIDMVPELRDALELHRLTAPLGSRDLIFSRLNGEPLDPERMVDREFRATARRAGLREIRFHDLRHTYAALQIAAGANPKYTQQQMGHSSIQITMDLYGHLMPDVEQQAAKRLGAVLFRGEGVTKESLTSPAPTGQTTINEEKEPVLATPNK